MLVADTLTADLTFYANGDVASDWEDTQSLRGVSEGDIDALRAGAPRAAAGRARGVLRPARAATPSAPVVTLPEGLETVLVRGGRAGQRARRARPLLVEAASVKAVVVALGKIGLPLAAQIARAGHEVIGCDIDAAASSTSSTPRSRPSPARTGWPRRWPRSSATGACARRPTRPRRSPRRRARRRGAAAASSTPTRAPTSASLDAVLADIGAGLQAGTTVADRDDAAGRDDAQPRRPGARPPQRPARRGGVLRRLQPRARLQRARVPRPRDLPQARGRPQRRRRGPRGRALPQLPRRRGLAAWARPRPPS